MDTTEKQPHVVCIPFPAQSHLKAMLNLAELLHHKGLQITFINTDFIHKRLLKSGGHHPLESLTGFQFQTIPDGIPRTSEDDEGLDDDFRNSIEAKLLGPFLEVVGKLPSPPSCIISDGFLSTFTIDAGQILNIPVIHYWTIAACAFMDIYRCRSLVDIGLAQLRGESHMKGGYLETVIAWIPGMKGIRLKDLSRTVQTQVLTGKPLTLAVEATEKAHNASHNIIHTFDALEVSIVNVLTSMFPRVYTLGPMPLLLSRTLEKDKQPETLNVNGFSLWKDEPQCFEWLQTKNPNSVIYVNFGSTTIMSSQDLLEFAWGLADSNHHFLWIIRSNLVGDTSAVLPPEFQEHIRGRGFIGSWCSQEKVLNHPSVGGFLTHCGWGSITESLSAGVPMICWPYMWDQYTNCRYVCRKWKVGIEMGMDVKREDVSKLVKEVMGKEGDRLRKKAMHWKEQAHKATDINGSSSLNVDKLVEDISKLSCRSKKNISRL